MYFCCYYCSYKNNLKSCYSCRKIVCKKCSKKIFVENKNKCNFRCNLKKCNFRCYLNKKNKI